MKKFKLFFASAILMFSFVSCEKEKIEQEKILENTCSVSHPVQELPWLRTYVESLNEEDLKYFYVQQADYNGQPVFIFNNCCPHCGSVVPLYDCEGNLICTISSQECPELLSQLRNIKVISDRSRLVCIL